MNSSDLFRLQVMRRVSSIRSFQDAWARWTSHGSPTRPTTAQGILEIGDKLSEIFQTDSRGNRTQSGVSAAGTVWECLVCWYLNLCFWGTDVVVVRPTQEVQPPAIRDALSVNIANSATNSESDLIAFSIPWTLAPGGTLPEIEIAIRQCAEQVDVGIIQCKTNWADNAQVPLLWDLIYRAARSGTSVRIGAATVGRNGIGPSTFRTFSYAFATVPTQTKAIRSGSLPVVRVSGLSGGNYWGQATSQGVARSIREYMTSNWITHYTGTIQAHLASEVLAAPDVLDWFFTLGFPSY